MAEVDPAQLQKKSTRAKSNSTQPLSLHEPLQEKGGP
jgi:hypothetical protein